MDVIAQARFSEWLLIGIVAFFLLALMLAPWFHALGAPFSRGQRVAWVNSHWYVEEKLGEQVPKFPLIHQVRKDQTDNWEVAIVLNEEDPKREWRTEWFTPENFRRLRHPESVLDQLRVPKTA